MELQTLLKFVDNQHQLLIDTKQASYTDRERILMRTVKIAEELGELSDEILGSLGDQRPEKMAGRDSDSLNNEFADVILTTFLLARMMNIDVLAAVEKKIQKIESDHNKQIRESL